MPDFDHTTFLSGSNAGFIADLYARYLDDPQAVDESWRRFFAEFGDDAAAIRAERAGPPWARPLPPLVPSEAAAPIAAPIAALRGPPPAKPPMIAPAPAPAAAP